MAEDEYYFGEKDVKRIGRTVRYVEGMSRSNVGAASNRRRDGQKQVWVVFQELMHFKKTTKTKAYIWLPDENNQGGKPEGKNHDDTLELEIFPGPIAKGIWFPNDIAICASIDPQGLAPIYHGRQYFEGTLAGSLVVNGTANVTVLSQTIEVKEGGFASATIPSGRKVGCQLAQTSSTTNPDYEWRAIIAKC